MSILTRIRRGIQTLIVLSLALIFLFPLYWMILTSLKHASVALSMPPEMLPKSVTLFNFKSLWERTQVSLWFFNSFFVSACTTFLVCATSALAGYTLAKKRFVGHGLIFGLVLSSLMIPREISLIPLFEMMMQFNWLDKYASLIIPLVGWPVGVFLLKQFMSTIPTELIEAARIDGSSELHTFYRIIVPLSMPGISALAIFTFMSTWNDYLWQLIMISSTKMKTLQVGVAGLQSEYVAEYGLLMAGAVIASMPMILMFIFFQRYFTEGITMGAVKG